MVQAWAISEAGWGIRAILMGRMIAAEKRIASIRIGVFGFPSAIFAFVSIGRIPVGRDGWRSAFPELYRNAADESMSGMNGYGLGRGNEGQDK